ncbi:ATP-grasp domain-containing protein [Gudongella sp. DL1XJH-153]|uniref:ATP-grasp domain-containing protein n=1 Tax=Gudongella sp. DL1XJH-153 TaxID=3409804 RepID=UPI003BB583E3
MNYILISPDFPSNFKQFAIRLKEEGVNVLGIGSPDFEYLDPKLSYALTEYYKVQSLEDYDQVLRAVAFLTFRHGRIHRIESQNEYWLELDAGLRTDFNIPGFKINEIAFVKHKSKMKEVFVEAGIPVARGSIVHSIQDAFKLIDETGYPVCAKPDIGVGASFTYKIHNEDDLQKFFQTKPDYEYIMEEFITGDIYTFDGIVDADGEISAVSSMHYGSGLMETVNEGRDSIFYVQRFIPDDVMEMGTKVIEAFQLRERFFHFEFFRLDNGSLVALELNARPPGGLCLETINYSMDADIYKQYAQLVAGKNPIPLLERKYFCAFLGLKTSMNPLMHTKEAIYSKYGDMIVYDAPNPPIFVAAMGEEAIIVRHPDLDVLKEAVKYITERY